MGSPRSQETYCTFCGSKEHPITLCDKTATGQLARAALACEFCGSQEHALAYCPKTWGGISARRLTPDGAFLD